MARFTEDATLAASQRLASPSLRNLADRQDDDRDSFFVKRVRRWLNRLIAASFPALADGPSTAGFAAARDAVLRLVFLRVCECRGIQLGIPLETIAQQPDVIRRVHESIRGFALGEAAFGDNKTPPVDVDSLCSLNETVLQRIIAELAKPKATKVLTDDGPAMLGSAFEQSLRVAARREQASGRRTGSRKAAGAYYTPRFVVDWIVEQTVGERLRGRTSDHVSALRIIDPSCGAGAFLLGAYRNLLDWHQRWYITSGPDVWSSKLRRVNRPDGRTEFGLTVAERQRILSNNIFGIDLDPDAVAVARAALLLEMCGAGNSDTSANRSLPIESALAAVSEHICAGDTLIESDFREVRNGSTLMRSETRVHPFNWKTAFADVARAGGFDAVVGNPPYVNVRLVKQQLGADVQRYFRQRYRSARGNYDLYVLFVERALELLRKDGCCGLIVPNKIATLEYAQPCRSLLLKTTTIQHIADLSQSNVFKNVGTYPYVLVCSKSPPPAAHRIAARQLGANDRAIAKTRPSFVKQSSLSAESGLTVRESIDVESRVPTAPLASRAKLHSGTTGFAAARTADELRERAEVNGEEHFEFIVSRNIDRYSVTPGEVRFLKRRFIRPVLAVTSRVLSADKRELFRGQKIVIAGMTRRLEAALDRGGLALGVQVYAASQFHDDPRYLLGLLNSRLLSYLFQTRFSAKQLSGGYLAINKGQLAKLPIRVIPSSDHRARRQRDRIVALVEKILDPPPHPGDSDIAGTSRANARINRGIDVAVYELYGLTIDEVRTVDAAFA